MPTGRANSLNGVVHEWPCVKVRSCSPVVKPAISFAVLRVITIAPRVPFEFRNCNSVKIVQVLGHPETVIDIYELVFMPIAFIGKRSVPYIRVQAFVDSLTSPCEGRTACNAAGRPLDRNGRTGDLVRRAHCFFRRTGWNYKTAGTFRFIGSNDDSPFRTLAIVTTKKNREKQ